LPAAERERMQRALERLESQEEARKREEREKAVVRGWKAEERKKRDEGKRAWYLKDGTVLFFFLAWLALSPLTNHRPSPPFFFCSRQEETPPRGQVQPAIGRQTQTSQDDREETSQGRPKGQKGHAASTSRSHERLILFIRGLFFFPHLHLSRQ
jgi:hypothetical protein